MKRGDLVFRKRQGDIAVVCGFAAPGDQTIAIVAFIDPSSRATQQRPSCDFAILNEDDAVPIEILGALDDFRQWLLPTGRKAP